MKKTLLIMFAVAFTFAANAQNTSKNGHQITPEANDWGIGIDVDPLLRYFGNMFNGNTNNSAPSWNYVDNSPIPMTITGYMIKDENTALRGKVRLGIGSNKEVSVISRDGSTTGATVEDEMKTSATNILIGAGLQKMRGKHRVKGFYGAEVMIGSGNGGKTTFDYGNPFNRDSTSSMYGQATVTDWSAGAGNSIVTSSRVTESKSGSTFYIGVRGFVGVEYFLAPKISIAGEFGWGIGLAATGEGETTTESFDFGSDLVNAIDDSVKSTTTKTGKSSSFSLDTDNGTGINSGSLRMTFYF